MQYFYNALTVLMSLLAFHFFKPFLGAYANKKGENLATKEDIAQITRTQEEIKARISDEAWNRQRHWELKRDVVIDLIRAMADMDRFIPDFGAAFSTPPGALTEEARQHLSKNRIKSFEEERRCTSEYLRVHTVADLAIHGTLSRASSSYFQYAAKILRAIPSNPGIYDSKTRLELAKLHNAAIIAARTELGVFETNDLPVLDYNNLPPTNDTKS